MKITKQMISELLPCKSRFDNFVDKYPAFTGTHSDFLSLDNITYSDKIWVMVRLMTMMQKRQFALACARSVLHIFEEKRPGDDRVRKCLDATSDYLEGKVTIEQLREARRAAYATAADAAAAYAYATAAATAYAYATAAATAAADAAAAATAAADAAAAYATDAAYATAAAADAAAAYAYATAARSTQQNLNLLLMNDVINRSEAT